VPNELGISRRKILTLISENLSFFGILGLVLGLVGCNFGLILAQEAGFGFGFVCCCYLWFILLCFVVLRK
jgi:hypothetical protein